MKYFFSAFNMSCEQIYRNVEDSQVDGVAVLGRYNESLLDYLKKRYKNVVYIGLNPIEVSYDQVICNGYDAARAAMAHLFDLGHTRVGYIGERSNEIRYKAYVDAMHEQGLEILIQRIADVTLSSEGGLIGARDLLERHSDITAVFCANDLTAIGAIKAFNNAGLRVPENLSVISIDDIESAQYLSPMLTTVHIPMDELGKIAVQTLISRIQKKHQLPMKISLPFYIAVRDSCRKLTDE